MENKEFVLIFLVHVNNMIELLTDEDCYWWERAVLLTRAPFALLTRLGFTFYRDIVSYEATQARFSFKYRNNL